MEWLVYAIAPVLAIPVFVKFGLYRAIFRYTGVAAILATSKAVGVYGLALAPFILVLFLWEGVPRSLCILQPVIFLLLVAGSRTLGWQWLAGKAGKRSKRLLIYGAGSAGAQTAAALSNTRQYMLLGFIDDDPSKAGTSIDGVLIYQPGEVQEIVRRLGVTDILLALPTASRATRNQIIARLQPLPVRIRSLPSVGDLASGRVTVDDFKDLDVEDLLGRDPVPVRPDRLAFSLKGQTVLVTGAGGSIGSELCRQIAHEGASVLLLVDHSEFALYAIHQELDVWARRTSADVRLVPLLANVCSAGRIGAICRTHRPTSIYHAAAYKHVPMVEANAGEGIINNVLGTLNMARVALECGVERFVLVSTDKAVRPTNVMGASKRVAEQVLQSLSAFDGQAFEGMGSARRTVRARTCFSMVRFGNVLGSSGSVVPLFRSQIAEGGPITVTHPDVTRYFMTISEAAQLVLHASAMAQGGDLFVLDMGAPIKILDLAKRMVALSGFTVRDDSRPAGDIEIRFTGLRPGEKLFEELLIGENPLPTEHPRIVRAREDFVDWPTFRGYVQTLVAAAQENDLEAMMAVLNLLVPGYASQHRTRVLPNRSELDPSPACS
jgi:FlaA1/EpsC-like NDP-sugar epimerase